MQSGQPKRQIGMTVSACVWLGLFPLLSGFTYSRLTAHKFHIMLVLCAFTVLVFLSERFPFFRRRPAGAAGNRTSVVMRLLPFFLSAALLLWTVLSCLFSHSGPDVWWISEKARYEGLASSLCYFAVFACFFFSSVRLKPVLLSAAFGVTLYLVIVLLQRIGGNPLGLFPPGRSYALNPEFQGTVGNIDMVTGYLLLLAGLFLYGMIGAVSDIRVRHKRCWFYLVILCLALLVTLYLIITMKVQFGVVALAVLSFLTFLRFLPKKWRIPVLIIVIVLVLLLVWFWPGKDGGIWELHESLHGRGRLSFGSNRIAVWLFSLRLARENLFLGGGSGTFVSRFNQYLSDHDLLIPHEQDGKPLPHYFDNPHSEYIQQLTDHGIPAVLLFLALLAFAVFRRRDRLLPVLAPCSAAVLCYAVQAFFSFSVCIVAPMFWVILGMSFNEYR